MNAKEFIKEGLRARDRENVYEIQCELLFHFEEGEPLSKSLEVKINNRMDTYGYKRAEIISQAITCPMAAVPLAKSAQRQGTGERLQLKYMNEKRGLDVRKLPVNGMGSIRIKNGEFIYNSSRSDMAATKTIDSVCNNDYQSLKYVTTKGGSQDNSIAEVMKFLKEANKYVLKHDDEVSFTAIVDGEYIESKIPCLAHLTNERVKIRTSDTYRLGKEISKDV